MQNVVVDTAVVFGEKTHVDRDCQCEDFTKLDY